MDKSRFLPELQTVRRRAPSVEYDPDGFTAVIAAVSPIRRHGFDVHLLVQVRRFRYCSGKCCRAIFAKRLDAGLTRPQWRRTARLQGLIRRLALALGGRPALSHH